MPDVPRAASSSAGPVPNAQDNVTPKNYREQFQGRIATSHFVDPCEDAAKASMKCLDRNDYDREQCFDFFQAYRDCKKTWIEERKADRRAGRPSA